MLNIAIRASVLVVVVISSLLTSPTIIKTEQDPQAYESQALDNLGKNQTQATVVTIKANKDDRERRLRNYLSSKGSPLAPYSKDFINTADKYGLDWRLMPAIAGVESTYGLFVPSGSYNPYGWNNGNFNFNSWAASTDYVAGQIKNRWGYLGNITPWKIGPSYAASPTWASKVTYYMSDISTN